MTRDQRSIWNLATIYCLVAFLVLPAIWIVGTNTKPYPLHVSGGPSLTARDMTGSG